MRNPSLLWSTLLAATLIVGGCDCGGDPPDNDGGTGDGGLIDGGDGGLGDGGGGDGGGGDGSTCTDGTAACAGRCGMIANGCGGFHDCATLGGATCTPGTQVCDGLTHTCKTAQDGGTCTPMPAATVCPGHCGFVGDGCSSGYQCDASNGGVVCASGTACMGTPGTCVTVVPGDGGVDGGSTCVPKTCGDLGHTCGSWPDGCGDVVSCPSTGTEACQTGQVCKKDTAGHASCVGGSQTCQGSLCASTPGGGGSIPACTPTSPTSLKGTVVTPGRNLGTSGSPNWVNRVPVPNAVVYIPAELTSTSALPAIEQGITQGSAASCGRCADEKFVASGVSVLASAITDYAGNFELKGRIPVGVAFDMVIKVGKWRRVVRVPATQVPATKACMSTNLSFTDSPTAHAASTTAYDLTRLSATNTDGSPGTSGTQIPHVAVSTGDVDAMECVLRKLGFADSEFTLPTGSGRIHMLYGNGAAMPGATCSGTTTWNSTTHNCSDSATVTINNNNVAVANYGCADHRTGCTWSNDEASVFASNTSINAYDMLVFDCQGATDGAYDDAGPTATMSQYVTNGGRLFASHWAYNWIYHSAAPLSGFEASAAWAPNADQTNSGTAYISNPMVGSSTYRPRANSVKAPVFRSWLDYVGALNGTIAGSPLENPTTPQFSIVDPRDLAGSTVGSSTDEWVYRNDRFCSGDANLMCGGNSDCMRCSNDVDWKCGGSGDCNGQCSNEQNRNCSRNSDCRNGGTCVSGATCQSKGTCGSNTVTSAARVQQLSFNTPYGASDADACGRIAYTGFHVAGGNNFFTKVWPAECANTALTPQELSLAFMIFDLNACVSTGDPITPPTCTPDTAQNFCPNANDACGQVSDGCGGLIDCGGCAAGSYCSGNSCLPIPVCMPKTCATLGGYVCGSWSDSCGGIATDSSGNPGCGMCPVGQACQANGQCSGTTCTPDTNACGTQGRTCGTASDGCGGTQNCGTCGGNQVCIQNANGAYCAGLG